MQPTNERPCPVCGKLLALFEKPNNPARLVGACNCGGSLREVIETDNPHYVSDQDLLEPAEPISPIPSVQAEDVTPPANQRKRSKAK